MVIRESQPITNAESITTPLFTQPSQFSHTALYFRTSHCTASLTQQRRTNGVVCGDQHPTTHESDAPMSVGATQTPAAVRILWTL